jgi:uncharacterized protein YndB with AHSA1/START domain
MGVTTDLAATDREFAVTRLLDAPRALVFDAWTRPEHVAKWWGPFGFTTTIGEMDVRTGGRWRLVMHGPDGTDYPNEIVFDEVVRPERLVYTSTGGRRGGPVIRFQATILFANEGGRTRVTMRAQFDSAAARDLVIRDYGALEGARQTLQRLAEHLTIMTGRTAPDPL